MWLDSNRGDRVCRNCGLVSAEREIDTSIRESATQAERSPKQRTFHHGGVRLMGYLNTYRFPPRSTKINCILHWIGLFAQSYGIPHHVEQNAYRMGENIGTRNMRGHTLASIGVACVVLSCLQLNIPSFVDEMIAPFESRLICNNRIIKAMHFIQLQLGLKPVIKTLRLYLPRLLAQMEGTEDYSTVRRFIAAHQALGDWKITHDPRVMFCAVLYVATRISGNGQSILSFAMMRGVPYKQLLKRVQEVELML